MEFQFFFFPSHIFSRYFQSLLSLEEWEHPRGKDGQKDHRDFFNRGFYIFSVPSISNFRTQLSFKKWRSQEKICTYYKNSLYSSRRTGRKVTLVFYDILAWNIKDLREDALFFFFIDGKCIAWIRQWIKCQYNANSHGPLLKGKGT